MWSTGEGNGKPLQYSCLENPMNRMNRQNDRILKEVLPRSVGAQYATGGQWRNNSRKNEGMEPKQKRYPAVDVIGDRSTVRCCKEQYCIGTWNVRSMNQGKLEMVKQEMASTEKKNSFTNGDILYKLALQKGNFSSVFQVYLVSAVSQDNQLKIILLLKRPFVVAHPSTLQILNT